jgi:hypothetical protein
MNDLTGFPQFFGDITAPLEDRPQAQDEGGVIQRCDASASAWDSGNRSSRRQHSRDGNACERVDAGVARSLVARMRA